MGSRTSLTRIIFFLSDASLGVEGEHGLSATSPITTAAAVVHSAAATVLTRIPPKRAVREGVFSSLHESTMLYVQLIGRRYRRAGTSGRLRDRIREVAAA